MISLSVRLWILCLTGAILQATYPLFAPVFADVLNSSILDSDDLIIPVFDSNLGTLNSVSLSITLRPGSTMVGGQHDHSAAYPIVSNNTIETTAVSPFVPFSHSIEATSGSTHFAPTPTYTGGGLSIGPFNLSLSTSGLHGHSSTVSFAGFQQVAPNAYRVVATIDPLPDSGHTHNYNPTGIARTYNGASEVAPFLAASNIVIPAGTFMTFPDSVHSHYVPPFSQTISTAVGSRTLNFPASNPPTVGGHTHQIDPRFDISATFTYDPADPPDPPRLTDTAYIANTGSNTISIVSLQTNSVINTVAVGDSPRYVALHPTGNRAYVTNSGSDSVSVINTASQSVISTISVGDAPEQIVVTRDGTRAYVANSNSASISVIDLASNTVIDTLTTATNPFSLALHPIRDELWIGLTDVGTQLEARSLTDHSLLGTASSFTRILASGGLAFYSDGSAAIGSESCGSCGRFHMISGEITGTTISILQNDILYDNQGAARGVAINPITDVAYLAKLGQFGGSNRVVELGGAGRTVLTDAPHELAVSADGAFLFLTQGGGTMAVIDTATFSIVDTITLGSTPHGIAILHIMELPGDYNHDGSVDAADYVMWRDSPTSHGGDPGGYINWHTNFGQMSGIGVAIDSASNNAVPEPTCLTLLALFLSAILTLQILDRSLINWTRGQTGPLIFTATRRPFLKTFPESCWWRQISNATIG